MYLDDNDIYKVFSFQKASLKYIIMMAIQCINMYYIFIGH